MADISEQWSAVVINSCRLLMIRVIYTEYRGTMAATLIFLYICTAKNEMDYQKSAFFPVDMSNQESGWRYMSPAFLILLIGKSSF